MFNDDSVQTKDDIVRIFNIIARALRVLHEIGQEHFSELYSINDFDAILNKIEGVLDDVWDGDVSTLGRYLESMVGQLEEEKNQDIYVKAYGIVVWLDNKFTFLTESKINHDKKLRQGIEIENYISLWSYLDLDEIDFREIGALNNNYVETGIWINPKLPVRKSYDAYDDGEINKREKPIGNRDAFWGINNMLNNMSYYMWDGKYKIKNIIMTDTRLAGENAVLRVAFAPITSKKDVIDCKKVIINRYGITKTGAKIHLNYPEDEINERMISDWKLACKREADIVFMPEVLGTRKVYGEYQENVDWMGDLYRDNMNNDLHSPIITIWPSYWEDGENSITMTYNDGSVIGIQKKHYPYIDKKNHLEEALKEYNVMEYIVIHIPNVHRVAVLICSEFLLDQESKWSDILCRSIGVTLLIVPSYTPGEQDFLNKVSRYNDLGTMVIWGNCCGASKSSVKSIGACSKPGSNSIEVFKRNMECNGECKNVKACIFVVKVPLSVLVNKQVIQSVDTEHIIEKSN